MTQLELVETAAQGDSRSGDGILDIDQRSAVELEVEEDAVGSAEVKENVAVIVADIDGIIVGLDATGGIGMDIGIG